jgi:chaperonin GroES
VERISQLACKLEIVFLPEYGVLDDKDYFLFRDGDILGKFVD